MSSCKRGVKSTSSKSRDADLAKESKKRNEFAELKQLESRDFVLLSLRGRQIEDSQLGVEK
jgi:hypothetical protein